MKDSSYASIKVSSLRANAEYLFPAGQCSFCKLIWDGIISAYPQHIEGTTTPPPAYPSLLDYSAINLRRDFVGDRAGPLVVTLPAQWGEKQLQFYTDIGTRPSLGAKRL